jgi:uncharacterized protein YcbK (DUF882 family)
MIRRSFLLSAAALGACPFSAMAAFPSPPRRLALRHVATGRTFSGPYFDGRRYDPMALQDLEMVLADSHTGDTRSFDERVFDILWEVGQRVDLHEFTILSGYRSPRTNRLVGGAVDSLHVEAKALDVGLPSSCLSDFAGCAMGLGHGGVGLYQSSSFVHIDCGPVRHWGSSTKGRRHR